MTIDRRRAAVAALLASLCVGAGSRPALPGERRVEIAGVSLRLDDERWLVAASERRLQITPAGAGATDRALVAIEAVTRGSATCAEVARSRFGEQYAEPKAEQTAIAGEKALRLSAQSRCRSAQPKGVVVCLERGVDALLVSAVKSSCQDPGASPFSEIDPLAEIVAGLRVPN